MRGQGDTRSELQLGRKPEQRLYMEIIKAGEQRWCHLLRAHLMALTISLDERFESSANQNMTRRSARQCTHYNTYL
jgi:hypothetical protein